MKTFKILFTASICFAFACAKPSFKVEYKGALKNMMHKGDISAYISLSGLKDKQHLYALGAAENLKGEVLIVDSKPYNSHVQNGKVVMDNSFNKKATLLVYTQVEKWKTITIPDSVIQYAQLEKYIEWAAKNNKINIEEPFPFLIQGTAKSADWHVIDWKDGDKEHTHEKHKKAGIHSTSENIQITILGFYSNKHHAVFTHHDTNMHLHIKTSDNSFAGHLDNLTIVPTETKLFLPE